MELIHLGRVGLEIPVEESSQIGQVRRSAQALAIQAGLDASDAGRVCLVATELATNVLKHGRSGVVTLGLVPDNVGGLGVEVCAVDRGDGFVLSDCLKDGYSTRGTSGIGLGAIRRQSNLLDAWSDAKGSIVLARTYANGAGDVAIGARRRAYDGGQVCGDGWYVRVDDQGLQLCLVDGLGHGPEAAKAADAGWQAFVSGDRRDPASIIAGLHQGMAGTRGGAAAAASFESATGQLKFCGVGNIAGRLLEIASSRGLASMAGIVGVQFRKAQSFDFPGSAGKLLVMHSDGLQSRWDHQHYPGLYMRHPALISAVLLRDFDRRRDDATIVVARLGHLT